jgi:hypothetical protein
MTKTLSTSDLREWARQNGYAVADRGRLPAQIHTAWEEDAQRTKAKATRRRTTSKAPAAPRVTTPKAMAGAGSGRAQTKDIAALQVQMAALTDRVQQLEKKLAAATAGGKTTKQASRRD